MEKIIEIDGRSGGQCLRTSLALSSITKKPVLVFNIRANRPKKGLAQQHLTGLNTLAKISKSKVKGNFLGSDKVVFYPKKIKPGNYGVNIGTAGSITLLLQTITLPLIFSETKTSFRIFGGTDVPFSPCFNYSKEVFFHFLSSMGAKFSLNLKRRGYFPKGNGLISFSKISSNLPLKPFYKVEQAELDFIKIFSHSTGFPKETSSNLSSAAKKFLSEKIPSVGFDESIEFNEAIEEKGAGISLVAVFRDRTRVGSSALQEKKESLKAGSLAAELLIKEIESKKPIDMHLADQLIPFMALAKGHSTFETSSLSHHTLNNISVTEKFLDVKFEVKGKINEPVEISVEGISFKGIQNE
ncbi:RNA 3'-terminal phosphate cyclase [Candidatus Micrarchaeota archaeon]|nr:RNA 3'-terminal phosphate cyclase [Candidatus Micrarchaeota archaeon]MBU2476165.1 RNA 3'-terminal phosphate cyclase [Candidatus Micrarchaeota archaeon]